MRSVLFFVTEYLPRILVVESSQYCGTCPQVLLTPRVNKTNVNLHKCNITDYVFALDA